MRTTLILASIFVLLTTSACATRSMSLSQARGLCFTYSTGGSGISQNSDSGGGDSCGDVNAICEGYLDEAMLSSLDRESCLAACRSADAEQRRIHLADGCYPYTKRANELCDVYCRGK